MRQALLSVALTVTVAACSTASYRGDESSPWYVPPVGAHVVLNREITIPPDSVSVMLQDGRITRAGDVNNYRPHCKFEVRRRLEVAQSVAPDDFLVTHVERNLLQSVDAAPKRPVSATPVALRVASDGGEEGDGASLQTYATRMTLRSDKQPGVLRLTCGQWAYPPEGEHLSIDDIRRALGEVLTLRIPKPE